MFLSCLEVNGMSLSSVLGEIRVDEMDEVVSDGGSEDTWHWNTVSYLFGVVALIDRDHGSGGHFINN